MLAAAWVSKHYIYTPVSGAGCTYDPQSLPLATLSCSGLDHILLTFHHPSTRASISGHLVPLQKFACLPTILPGLAIPGPPEYVPQLWQETRIHNPGGLRCGTACQWREPADVGYRALDIPYGWGDIIFRTEVVIWPHYMVIDSPPHSLKVSSGRYKGQSSKKGQHRIRTDTIIRIKSYYNPVFVLSMLERAKAKKPNAVVYMLLAAARKSILAKPSKCTGSRTPAGCPFRWRLIVVVVVSVLEIAVHAGQKK